MNKKELINAFAEAAKIENKSQASRIVESIFDTITSTLKKGEEVAIAGFGKFKVKQMKPRTARNPKTGEKVEVPAKHKVVFKAGKELKEAVDK